MREQDSSCVGPQVGLPYRSLPSGDEAEKVTRITSAVAAIALASIVLFGTAFAGPEILHNAAHDVRHGFAFPCH